MAARKPGTYQSKFPANAIMPPPAISSRSGGTPSITGLRTKLSRLVFHHDQLKIAFHHLNLQIRAGLVEAEDVFASMAMQLMKLVGLKTVEMATEGRFSSVLVSQNDGSRRHTRRSTEIDSDKRPETNEADEINRAKVLEEENILARANKASKELREKQNLQLMILVQLLKQIEVQVNSSQENIFQSLDDHRASIQNYFQKAVSYVCAIRQDCEPDDMSLITLKLLKSTYDHVGSALGAVEIGVEELLGKLAEKMCVPMVKYVNDLRYEMTAGAYPSMWAMLEEMEAAIKLRRLELEEARKKAREAEKIRMDVVSKLKETEERMRKMKQAYGVRVETKKWSIQQNTTEKGLEVEEDQSKDEKLLWDLLRKRRKLQTPHSPFGPTGLLGTGITDRNFKSTRIHAPYSSKPLPMRHSAKLSPRTPSVSFPLQLGSSPSVATQKFAPRFK